MKLPGLKRDTQAMLDRAQQDFVVAETQIVSLHQQRMSLLLDAEPGQIEAIDQRLADLHRQRTVFADRISGLEQRLAQEQAAQREDEYRQAVDKIAAALPRRAKAAEEIERALAALAGATKEFMIATEAVLASWPPGVAWPARVYPAYALSVERLGAFVQGIFQPPRGHADKRPPTPSEFLTRACDADRHRGFARREKELHEEFLADLKTAHDPPPVETEAIEDEAAA
jgi:hypothetical protein